MWQRTRTGLAAAVIGLGFVMACAGVSAFAAEQALVKLAAVGPWSSVSALIGFGDRLWFANSVKHVNHNSCDLYSYDPASGALHYERHLFSQDAGEPTVLNGRLYWPFEDARGSAGVGEFAATDGAHWNWRVIPGALAFHNQAMHTREGSLFAGMSAWQAVIARSDDEGLSWRIVYRHPTEDRRVSRITAFATLNDRVFAGLTARRQAGSKLLVETEDGFAPLKGWPALGGTTALAAFGDMVYGAHWRNGEADVWRTDGTRVERVVALDGAAIRAFAASADRIYAIGAGGQDGTLWTSVDGQDWRKIQTFANAQPEAIALYAGRIFVGTTGPGAYGALWGPPVPAPIEQVTAPIGPLPAGPEPFENASAADDAFEMLDDELSRPQTYSHGFAALVAPFASSHRPGVGAGLQKRLSGPYPVGEMAMFGGAVRMTPREIGRWYLLRALGLNGHGPVPPAFLAEPIRSKPNGVEKYFDIAPLAAWTAGELGQDADDTIAALIGRLGNAEDPPWLDGDLIGALTAITGERFGYDVEAWRRWWRTRNVQSRPDAINRSASARSSGVLTLKNGSTASSSNATVAMP